MTLDKSVEDNVRQGFFESEKYIALLKALPAYVIPIVTFGYRTGWRKNEILGLTWDRVNLKERTVILTPHQTKNKESRVLYLDNELLKILQLQYLRKAKDCHYVFHRDGQKISNFRKLWKSACTKTGNEGMLFHDFRRTAVRNLTRSGTKETVAMKITGHKTRSVFDRYNITSGDDIKKAMVRQADYLSRETTTETATISENQGRVKVDTLGQVVKINK
jgi:integrase